MEPRDDEDREPNDCPEVPKEPPKLKRFRIVKLEERIAPAVAGTTREPPPCTFLVCISNI